MKLALLAAAVAALAVAAPQYAQRAYHGVQHVVAKAGGVPASSSAGATPIDPKTVPPTIIGMNVGVLSYWSTEHPFYDPLKAHGWMALGDPSHNVELRDQLKRDATGGFTDVPKDTHLLVAAGGADIAVKPLNCEVSPGWKMDSVLPGSFIQSGSRFSITVKPQDGNGGLWLSLVPTVDHATLDKLDCHPNGQPAGTLFRPDYLADMKPFRIIRFMNWMLANSDPSGKWSERPMPGQPAGVQHGISVETMVALANLNHSDPWFTLPFDADDEYQRNFATYVRDHLDPGLKAYVELSNEVWNSAFPQSKKASALGAQRYPSEDGIKQNDFYYADRVGGMMAIWSEVFAGQQQRLVRVLANQAGWSQRAENALGHAQTWKSVDVLAVAPYFGDFPFDVKGNGPERVNGILAKIPGYIDQALGWAKANKAVANKYGLRLVAYEGGPGVNAVEHDMVQDVAATYHDPRIIPLYTTFLERWRKEIGGELVLFDYAGGGFWSHLDKTGQPASEAPKMKAVIDFIATLPPGSR